MERISNEADAKPKPRTFLQAPNKQVIDELVEFILKTGRPEDHSDLHHGPISKNEPFTILSKIKILRSQRSDGDLAPCPMCSQPNKFLDGRIVYFHDLQAVAVIGHDCANKENSRDAERRYEAAQALARADDYLLGTLHRLKEWEVAAATLLLVATEAEEFSRRLVGQGKEFHRALKSGLTTDGRLHVTEVIETPPGGPGGMRTSTSSQQTRDTYFGQLGGGIALRISYKPARAIHDTFEPVKRHLKPDEEAAFQYVAGMTDGERVEARKSLIGTAKRLREIQSQLIDFQ